MSEAAKPLQAPVGEIAPNWQGSIVINLFKEKAAECTFQGNIKGQDMSVALRALMRGYKRWKSEQARDENKLKVNKEK